MSTAVLQLADGCATGIDGLPDKFSKYLWGYLGMNLLVLLLKVNTPCKQQCTITDNLFTGAEAHSTIKSEVRNGRSELNLSVLRHNIIF